MQFYIQILGRFWKQISEVKFCLFLSGLNKVTKIYELWLIHWQLVTFSQVFHFYYKLCIPGVLWNPKSLSERALSCSRIHIGEGDFPLSISTTTNLKGPPGAMTSHGWTWAYVQCFYMTFSQKIHQHVNENGTC